MSRGANIVRSMRGEVIICQDNLDIMIVDMKTKVARRPMQTTVIDSFTRCIVDWRIE